MLMNHPYLVSWLEIARHALKDADFFDGVADHLDISDEEMQKLRDALETFMEV